MIRRAHEINNLLLSPPRFRRTLIVYFQLIMQSCYRNWYWCLSRPSRARWAAEKIVRKCSIPGMVFGACQAELQRTILFFAEIARRSFVRTGGREHSNLKSINGKNVDKDVRRGFVFALAYFFFGLLYYTEANMTTSCEMELFNFLWLIRDYYLPLAPTKNDRPPWPHSYPQGGVQIRVHYIKPSRLPK